MDASSLMSPMISKNCHHGTKNANAASKANEVEELVRRDLELRRSKPRGQLVQRI